MNIKICNDVINAVNKRLQFFLSAEKKPSKVRDNNTDLFKESL